MRHVLLIAAVAASAACAPTVKIQGGGEPITINLNVNIKQEVVVKVDKDLENLIDSKPGVF